jgi:hypothetical protein
VDVSAAVDYVNQFLSKPGTTPQITITGGDTGSIKGTLVMTRLVGGYHVEVKGWVQVTAAGNTARVVLCAARQYGANQTALEQAATTVISS